MQLYLLAFNKNQWTIFLSYVILCTESTAWQSCTLPERWLIFFLFGVRIVTFPYVLLILSFFVFRVSFISCRDSLLLIIFIQILILGLTQSVLTIPAHYHKNTSEIPNLFTFAAKGAIYYAAIATVIFLRVKIMFGNARLAFGTILENLWKVVGNLGKIVVISISIWLKDHYTLARRYHSNILYIFDGMQSLVNGRYILQAVGSGPCRCWEMVNLT